MQGSPFKALFALCVSGLVVRHVFPEDGSWGGYLGRNALQLVKLIERRAASADAICRCRQMGCPVTHDLLSETCLRWRGVGVTFFFGRILHCIKEVEGKEKGDHVRSLPASFLYSKTGGLPMV